MELIVAGLVKLVLLSIPIMFVVETLNKRR